MNYKDLSQIAMDNLDFLCYITDIETLELIYLNNSLKKLLGFKNNSEYIGKKCYEVLQGKASQCEFCNNHKLEPNKSIKWEYYNPSLKKYFTLIDTLIEVDGRKARLEIAIDISEQNEKATILEYALTTEQTLTNCIQVLASHLSTDEAFKKSFSIIKDYYVAKNVFLLEMDYTSSKLVSTYNLVEGDINTSFLLSDFFTSASTPEFDIMDQDFILDINNYDPSSFMYKTLKDYNYNRVLWSPIMDGDKFLGGLAIADPANHQSNLKLLSSIALFLSINLAQREMVQKLEYMSYTDELSGLYNRNKFVEVLDSFEKTPTKTMGIIFADINGLKQANEIYGHHMGDTIIKDAAALLKNDITPLVFRIAGDEFVSLYPEISQEKFSEIVYTIRNKMETCDRCSLSIGTVWKSGRFNLSKEITYSSELMFADKQAFYRQNKDFMSTNFFANIAKKLIKEIEENKFEVYFQPKVELESLEIIGCEALIRKHGEYSYLIPPDKFIPIYEANKIIRHVDFFVLDECCKTLKKWIENGRPIKISVNISRITFMEHDISESILNICKKHNVPTKYIDIEVTESINKIDLELLTEKINTLQSLGFSISLDDFGARYSNLLMLANISFSEIKLDKSLIDNVCVNKNNNTIVKNVINMIHHLHGSSSLAEGIEHTDQHEMLKSLNCKYGQGYYYYRPMPINDFEKIYLQPSKY